MKIDIIENDDELVGIREVDDKIAFIVPFVPEGDSGDGGDRVDCAEARRLAKHFAAVLGP